MGVGQRASRDRRPASPPGWPVRPWRPPWLTARREDGGSQLVSDHPTWNPVAFPEDAVILGRVVWAARALV